MCSISYRKTKQTNDCAQEIQNTEEGLYQIKLYESEAFNSCCRFLEISIAFTIGSGIVVKFMKNSGKFL